MDGMEIINSFKKETFYEFSEAIPVFDSEIYFIFKADVISIEANPSPSRIDKLKELIKNSEKRRICETSLREVSQFYSPNIVGE